MAARLLAAISILALAAVLVRLARHARHARELASPPDAPGRASETEPAGPPPLVSVLVPARDEERSLEPCLRSLLAQDHAPLEILVWDDDSRDATSAIAARIASADARLRLFRGSGPPPGWMGKCHALDRLAEEARGEWLLFTDADTVHARDSVSRGLALARAASLEALTASGEGLLGSFWERAWEPVWPAFLLAWLAPRRLDDPDDPLAFGVGQWLLISRRAYAGIGGHAAVRAEIVEDCALAGLLKKQRIPFRVLLGTRLFRVRMYRSLGEIWEGWSKNAETALRLFGGGPLAAPLSALLLLLVTVAPFALALAAAAGALPGLGPFAAYAPALLALAASLLLRLRRGRNGNAGYFWTLPLAGALAALILTNSAWRSRTGRPLTWKGRAYPGGRPPGGSR